MEVTENQLAGAIETVRLDAMNENSDISFLSSSAIAARLFTALGGPAAPAADPEPKAEPTAPGHAGEAAQALSASTWQRQKWGESANRDDLRSAAWELERAKVHALLDVADAVRELTSGLNLGGVRDDLGEIGHAIRSHQA